MRADAAAEHDEFGVEHEGEAGDGVGEQRGGLVENDQRDGIARLRAVQDLRCAETGEGGGGDAVRREGCLPALLDAGAADEALDLAVRRRLGASRPCPRTLK